MAKLSPELSTHLPDRTIRSLASFPERNSHRVVLGTDVEGPLFLGDFIAESMAMNLKPKDGSAVNASPSYGQIIYQESWDLFTAETFSQRRSTPDLTASRRSYSLGQEGTDTIFTLPLLLAEGADYDHLKKLTLDSKQTPGSQTLVKELQRQGVFVLGITTAPQEPYRDLFEQTGFMDRAQVVGSPFPLEEARAILHEAGVWDEEIGMTQQYLAECYRIIDAFSTFTRVDGHQQRTLSKEGSQRLQERIKRYHDEELGITYDPEKRKTEKPHTLLGEIIHASGMVGDRAKAAISQDLRRNSAGRNGTLITMGDGANDAIMLQRAPISIGINGSDAAKAAKIGVITPSMEYVLPIFQEVLKGERDIDVIVGRAQAEVGGAAIIHRGGIDINPFLLTEHKKQKKLLRGENITY